MESSRASLDLRTHFEVFGLEAHKSSKMSYPRLEDSTFFVSLKMNHGHDLFFYFTWEIGKNLAENLERIFFSAVRLKKILKNFFLRRRTLAPCVLGLKKSVLSLGLEGCVLDSTSVKKGLGISLYSLPLIK